MADWTPSGNFLIGQNIDETSTTKKHELGTRVRMKHATYGVGEFIYLLGVASTAAGSWVTYSSDDYSTALLTGSAKGPVGVAMSANVADQYGWYQIYGKGSASAADVADDADVYIGTAAGTCDDAVVTGDRVHRAKWASADDTSTNLADVEIEYPFVDDGAGGGST